MKRRTWVLLAAVVVTLAGVISGSLLAIGLGGGDTTRPTGAETVLRIQPVEEEVSCGPGPATIWIFLEDLEARPSPRQPDASYGVAGFQFLLRYDPDIVRIAHPIDVQLNPRLSQEDADGDGVARTFIPVSNIDDGAGRALLGAASLVPTTDAAERLEEGLDPVAKGEPIVLMTVRFLPVGHGTTALTLGDPEGTLPTGLEPGVIDPSRERYEPLVLKGASLTVAGGECPEGPFATPRPTPGPTSTPFVPPTPDIPTPLPLTPTPAVDGGRSDCPQEWNVYRDPHGYFALCYPPDWSATTSRPDAYLGQVLTLQSPVPETGGFEAALLTVYWEKASAFHEGVISDRCHAVSHWENLQELTLTIAGRSVIACTGYETLHAPDAPPLRSTFAEIPIGPGAGYVVLFLTQAEGTAYAADRDASASVLESLRLGE